VFIDVHCMSDQLPPRISQLGTSGKAGCTMIQPAFYVNQGGGWGIHK